MYQVESADGENPQRVCTLLAFVLLPALGNEPEVSVKIVSRTTDHDRSFSTRGAPFLALAMLLALLSLAGVPPLSGFFGKFLVLWPWSSAPTVRVSNRGPDRRRPRR